MRRELPGDLRDAFRIDKKGTKGKAGRNDEDGLARVPEHLRVVICRREVVKTYGKITYEAAKRRHYREIAEVDRLITEARAWLASQGMEARAEPASHLVTPTLADAKAAILSWFHRQEGRRLARPVPDDPDDREAVLDALRGENAALTGEDGRQRAERVLFGDDPARTGDAVPSTSIKRLRVDRHGAGILASAGFAAPSGDVRRIAVEIMQQVMAEGVRRDLERYGELAGAADSSLSGITVLSSPPPAPVAGITFGQLVDRYLAAPERAGLSPKTKLKYAGFRRVLVEIIGETTAASAVDRAACRDAQAVLLALPANAAKRWPKLTARQAAQKAKAEGADGMHPKSAGNHLDFLASVFGFGAREGLVEKNPASGLNASTAKGTAATANGEKRRPFTLDELRKVFAAPLYTGCVDDGNGYDKPGPNQLRRGRYWVPLVGLWTGMRLNEVCQLGVADVETVDGVHIIHVRASAEGARLRPWRRSAGFRSIRNWCGWGSSRMWRSSGRPVRIGCFPICRWGRWALTRTHSLNGSGGS
jgi:hypothetical protein